MTAEGISVVQYCAQHFRTTVEVNVSANGAEGRDVWARFESLLNVCRLWLSDKLIAPSVVTWL